MADDLISKKTRNAFQEVFVRDYVLRTIQEEFDAAELSCAVDFDPDVTGERRTLVQQYYRNIDFSKWDDVRKLLRVFDEVLDHIVEEARGKKWGEEEAEQRVASLLRLLDRDGFVREGSQLVPKDPTALATREVSIEDSPHFDLPELRRQIERMRSAVDNDPELAVGTAKELVETTCKTILSDRGVTFAKDANMSDLVKAVRKELKLLPDDIPDASKGVEVVRRLLSNLGTVGQGVVELRGLYGTGHGKHARRTGVPPRIARLAAGSAATLSVFLLETHEERE